MRVRKPWDKPAAGRLMDYGTHYAPPGLRTELQRLGARVQTDRDSAGLCRHASSQTRYRRNDPLCATRKA